VAGRPRTSLRVGIESPRPSVSHVTTHRIEGWWEMTWKEPISSGVKLIKLAQVKNKIEFDRKYQSFAQQLGWLVGWCCWEAVIRGGGGLGAWGPGGLGA
jgi:hypothetical protein